MKLNYYADIDALYIDLSERRALKAERFLRMLSLITMPKEI